MLLEDGDGSLAAIQSLGIQGARILDKRRLNIVDTMNTSVEAKSR